MLVIHSHIQFIHSFVHTCNGPVSLIGIFWSKWCDFNAFRFCECTALVNKENREWELISSVCYNVIFFHSPIHVIQFSWMHKITIVRKVENEITVNSDCDKNSLCIKIQTLTHVLIICSFFVSFYMGIHLLYHQPKKSYHMIMTVFI